MIFGIKTKDFFRMIEKIVHDMRSRIDVQEACIDKLAEHLRKQNELIRKQEERIGQLEAYIKAHAIVNGSGDGQSEGSCGDTYGGKAAHDEDAGGLTQSQLMNEWFTGEETASKTEQRKRPGKEGEA